MSHLTRALSKLLYFFRRKVPVLFRNLGFYPVSPGAHLPHLSDVI